MEEQGVISDESSLFNNISISQKNLEEAERLRLKVEESYKELMKIGGYQDQEVKYNMPHETSSNLDLERWFNELTHKYLEYVRRCHLECVREPLQHDVREKFTEIKSQGLNEVDIRDFADLLNDAIQELN